MISVTFNMEQLTISQTKHVYPNQKIALEIRRILQNSGIDISNWENISCQIIYNQREQDYNKTYNEALIGDSASLFIKLSMNITLEILNKQFPSLQINVDAFDRTKQFKDYMIVNYLRNTNYDIIIINGLDGKQIEKDTWIQNGIGNSIPILLNISAQQNILWKGEVLGINFNVFYPISKIIQNFKNKLNINEIISLQCQNAHLKPELTYFNHNLPLNVQWQANVPNELIYRVYYQNQRQSREKQIICGKDQLINEIIQQLRKDFNINKTNKITLMYQWALNYQATFAQEAIPNYSILKLVEDENKGEFQINLQNITENQQQIQQIQTLIVNNDTSLEELSRRILLQENQQVNFYLESQDQILNPKLKMEELNIYYGALLRYKIVQIVQKPKIKQIQKQIQNKKFGVLIVDINIVINIETSIENNLMSLAEIIRYKLSLPSNQILKFSLGTKLFQGDECMKDIMEGEFEFLQASLLQTLDINFYNTIAETRFSMNLKLEDTLRKVSEKQKIEAKFSYNGKQLGLDETFAQLKIPNSETINYELVNTPKEENEIPIVDSQRPREPPNEVQQPFPINNNIVRNEIQQQQVKQNQNNNQTQTEQPAIDLNNVFITVNASVGEKVYTFKLNKNCTFDNLKQVIFDLAIQGEKQNIKLYNLTHGEQVLRDEQTVSTLNKKVIDIQFKLK